MGVRRDLLLWFVLLYGMLYCSFGFSSPFLPEFPTTRGIGAEWLGFLLGAGTAVRLLSAPFAGRLADVFGAFRLELALFALAAAAASLLYLPTHNFWLLAFVNLTQAAMLAPLVRSRMLSPFPGLADNARQFGSFRIWLGSRHRLRRLSLRECSWQGKARPCWGCLQSLAHYRRPFRDGVIDTICARPCTRHKFNNSKKEGDRGRLACSFCDSPYSCVWFSRPLLLLGAMRCMTRSPSYAGVTPDSPCRFERTVV